MPSTYGATPIQPNQNVQTKTGKYVGIGLLCACVLTIGVSMKEDASTFTGMSTKSENKIYTEFSDDGDFTSKRDSFLGMKGVNGCPNGTEPIYDHTECRTQAANLGFSYYEKYTTSSDNSVVCNYCSGCDKLNTPNIIEDGGSTVRVDQSHASRAYWVCKAITAKPTAAPTGSPTTSPTTTSPTTATPTTAIPTTTSPTVAPCTIETPQSQTGKTSYTFYQFPITASKTSNTGGFGTNDVYTNLQLYQSTCAKYNMFPVSCNEINGKYCIDTYGAKSLPQIFGCNGGGGVARLETFYTKCGWTQNLITMSPNSQCLAYSWLSYGSAPTYPNQFLAYVVCSP